MGSDLYFFQQVDTHKVPRRYRKLPEELPESLRFAHLNPKVAALLASKERSQRPDNEDPFGDGMGKKSLLPDINQAFTTVRNQFDSALSNDEDSQRYLFEEAKMSAPTILEQLSRIIYYYEDLYNHIPKSLEYQLLATWSDLTSDITIVPREWQTHDMKEQFHAKQQQDGNSEEDASDNDMLTGRSKSRMGTSDRSTSELGGKLNVKRAKPRLGVIDGADEGEGMIKLDSRMGHRSSSRASAAGSIRQHLDIGSMSRVGSRRKGSSLSSHRSITGMSPSFLRTRTKDDLFSMIAETPPDARSTALANPLSYMQTIPFQLSNPTFEEKGWVMLKGRQEEIDQNEILEYCVTRMQDSMKQIAAQRQKDSEQGHDNPVIVRYYGDTKKETLLKYRKSPVKSSPSLISKGGKPRIPSIIDERNEGKKLMQASHIDGSTIVYYPSGRPAIIHSAAGFGRPGYYTVVYEDGLDSKMLACFTPCGKGVCYHENGVVRFLATDKGGHLSETNGKLVRRWKWPQASVKITEPLSFQVSNNVMFRCVSQGQMTVVFSCQKEMARFNVGPIPDAEDYKFIDESDQLLTSSTFSSKAAKDLMRIFAPPKKSKRKGRKARAEARAEARAVAEAAEAADAAAEAATPSPTSATGKTKAAADLTATTKKEKKEKKDPKEINKAIFTKPVSTDEETIVDKPAAPRPRRMSMAATTNNDLDPIIEARAALSQEDTFQKWLQKNQFILDERDEDGDDNDGGDDEDDNEGNDGDDDADDDDEGDDDNEEEDGDDGDDDDDDDGKAPTNLQEMKKALKNKLMKGMGGVEARLKKMILKDRERKKRKTENSIFFVTPDLSRKHSARLESPENTSSKPAFLGTIEPSQAARSAVDIGNDKRVKSSKVTVLKPDTSTSRVSSSTSRSRRSLGEDTAKRAKSAKSHTSKASNNNLVKKRSSKELKPSAQAVLERLDAARTGGGPSPRSQCTLLSDRDTDSRTPDPNSARTYVESSSRQSDIPGSSRSLKSIMKKGSGPISHSSMETQDAENLSPITSGHSGEAMKRAKSASGYGQKNSKSSEERLSKSAKSHEKKSKTSVEGSKTVQAEDVDETGIHIQELPLTLQKSKSYVIPEVVVEGKDGEMLNVSANTKEPDTQRSSSCTNVSKSTEKCSDPKRAVVHDSYFSPVSKMEIKGSKSHSKQKSSPFSSQKNEIPMIVIQDRDGEKQKATKIDLDKQIAISCSSAIESTESSQEGPKPSVVRESYFMKFTTSKKPSKNLLDQKSSRRLNVSKKTSDSYVSEEEEFDSDEFEKRARAAMKKRVRRSTVMKSIMKFRKKVMAKRGIFFSDESTSEYDSDSSDSQTSKSQASEIIKLMEDFPDKVTYDIEADKELGKLQRKAKNLVEDWMEHYRIAIGLASPFLQNVRETPNYSIANRHAKSARLSDHQQLIRKAILGVDDESTLRKARIPSAPLGPQSDDEDGRTTATDQRLATTVTFDDRDDAGDGTMSPSAMLVMNRLTETASRRSNRSKTSSAHSTSPSRQPQDPRATSASAIAASRSHCPLVLRQFRLGYERPQCRCSRHHIPFIMDLELDDFVATETPEGQVIVVMIVSSLFPGITKAEEMLNELYTNQNRNRTRPCVQSRSDMFRVFKYDINTAAEMSDHTQPLLLTRHNVVPGMFLIYCDGRLLFCDHIFNGYGNTRKDFKKQVMKSRHDHIQGFALPKDFKFSPSQGRSGMRSAWGGEIGGAGVDKYSSSGTVIDVSLQPVHRPISSSTDSGVNKEVHIDAVNKDVVDLGPFHQEIQVRLKPLISARGPQKRSSNRRPFLPQIDPSQIGAGNEGSQYDTVHDWVSASLPGIQPQPSTLSKSTSFATSLSDATLFNTTISS